MNPADNPDTYEPPLPPAPGCLAATIVMLAIAVVSLGLMALFARCLMEVV